MLSRRNPDRRDRDFDPSSSGLGAPERVSCPRSWLDRRVREIDDAADTAQGSTPRTARARSRNLLPGLSQGSAGAGDARASPAGPGTPLPSPPCRNPRRRVAKVATLGVAIALGGRSHVPGFVVNPYDLRILRWTSRVRARARTDSDPAAFRRRLPEVQSNLDRADGSGAGLRPRFSFSSPAISSTAPRRWPMRSSTGRTGWFDGLPRAGGACSRRRGRIPQLSVPAILVVDRGHRARGEREQAIEIRGTGSMSSWPIVARSAPLARAPRRRRWTATAQCGDTDTYIQLARPGSCGLENIEVTLALPHRRRDGRVLLRLAADPLADLARAPPSSSEGPKRSAFPSPETRPGKPTLQGRAESGYIPPPDIWIRCRPGSWIKRNATDPGASSGRKVTPNRRRG
jgi:hypothetical protein